MSSPKGNKQIILSKMEDGVWYNYEQISEITSLSKSQVNSTMQYLDKVEMVESIVGQHKASSRLYRKIEKTGFGVSSRLQAFNQYWRGAHAV